VKPGAPHVQIGEVVLVGLTVTAQGQHHRQIDGQARRREERLAVLGFTRSGRHWLIGFSDGETLAVEVPADRLFELAAESPDVIDLDPGRLAVITIDDLMMDRLLAATEGEPVTFEEAVRLAVAAHASISWAKLEDRSRDAAATGTLAGGILPTVLRRVRRAAVRALRDK